MSSAQLSSQRSSHLLRESNHFHVLTRNIELFDDILTC